MRVGRSGKVSRSPIFDVMEDFSFVDTPGSLATPRPLVLAGEILSPTGTNFMFQGTGGAAPGFETKNEAPARSLRPGTAQTAIAYSGLTMPIGRDLSRFPLTVRQHKRYVWDTLIQRTLALSATAKFFIGMADDAAELGAANQSIGILSDATLNAGRWTGKYQLVTSGAVLDAGDSGVAPDGTPQHIRFEYFDMYPAPTLNIYIGGVRKFSFTGATLPAMGSANEPWNLILCAGGAAHAIGQQDFNFFNRYTIELL